MTVERFRGEYFPFSNMYPLETWIEADCGIAVPTSEHAYMSGRFADREIQEEIAQARAYRVDVRPYRDGLAAKQMAHQYIRDGAELLVSTDIARIGLMKRVVQQKVIRNNAIHDLLLNTGNQEIYEGNTWNDRFWGVSPVGTVHGQNHLGRILMQIRDENRG